MKSHRTSWNILHTTVFALRGRRQRSRNVDREMTHRFRPQKDCRVAIGHFFSSPSVPPLRPDQVFSVTFGSAHNRAEFASTGGGRNGRRSHRPRDGYDIAGNRYAISRAIHARVIPNTNGIWIYPKCSGRRWIIHKRGVWLWESAENRPLRCQWRKQILRWHQLFIKYRVGCYSCDCICRDSMDVTSKSWLGRILRKSFCFTSACKILISV